MRAKRDTCGGWSKSSTRSNRNFLYSVDERGLSGFGFAVSLTLADCPPDHAAWAALRKRFFQRLRDTWGLLRAHWLTEWQRRMVPHMHAAIWFPESVVFDYVRSRSAVLARYSPDDPEGRRLYAEFFARELVSCWLGAIDCRYAVSDRAQCVKPIADAVGWFKYLAKHAVRGLAHYQRSAASIPDAWRGRTGRMWGHLGDWPCSDPLKLEMGSPAWWKLRRLVRRYRIADARAAVASCTSWKDDRFRQFAFFDDRHRVQWLRRLGLLRRLKSARGMLRCNDPKLSAVLGIAEWATQDLQLDFVAFLHASGYTIREVTP